MIPKIIVSFLIFIGICIPAIAVSIPAVAIMLLTKWDGRTTIFGNAKWGRATDQFAYPTKGKYWREFIWLVYRNPVDNLCANTLALDADGYTLRGDKDIGDKTKGGFYSVSMGSAWEYYWVLPYNILGSRRCIRARIGWKIKDAIGTAPFVFSVNPVKAYAGT